MKRKDTIRIFMMLSFALLASQYHSCKKIDLERQVMIKPEQAQDVQISSAKLSAEVIDKGEEGSILSYGFVYDTSPGATVENEMATVSGNTLTDFSVDITSLEPATTYYFRPFAALNGGEYYYGAELSFTTLQGSIFLPQVETSGISNLTQSSVTITGMVSDNGGATIIRRGICIDTQPAPDITGMCSDDGTGMGQFSHSFTGLASSTTYHVRAYAENQKGVAYGDDLSFTTSGGTSVNEWLHHDSGINEDAIGFSGYNFDAVIRFPASLVQNYLGTKITKIRFFPYPGSSALYSIEIYTGISPDANDPLQYEDIPESLVEPGTWCEYDLNEDFLIEENADLWVGVYVQDYFEGEYPVGTDAGPAVSGFGDLFYDYESSQWIALSDLDPPFDVNWNLQVFVSNQAGKSSVLSHQPVARKINAKPPAISPKISSYKSSHSSFEK